MDALIFDLDGTLIDSVYQHVLAWRTALQGLGANATPLWRIHRRIGMGGDLLMRALLEENQLTPTPERLGAMQDAHARAFQAQSDSVRPLPGVAELLAALDEQKIRWAIATSSGHETADENLKLLGLDRRTAIVVGREDAQRGKPFPDLILAASQRLGVAPARCAMMGDSIWDMIAAQRAGSGGIGCLSGGSARADLRNAGAAVIVADPRELLHRLSEIRQMLAGKHAG